MVLFFVQWQIQGFIKEGGGGVGGGGLRGVTSKVETRIIILVPILKKWTRYPCVFNVTLDLPM